MGLAPGFVGLNQINVIVSRAAPAGDSVPFALAISGATAIAITIAIQTLPIDP